MTGPTTIIVGNLTADPELRYTQSGLAVAALTIAHTPRVKKGDAWEDGEPIFLRGSVWRDYAEHVASSLTKGCRVIASGTLKQRNWETPDGERRYSVELDIDAIGPDLRYATASVTKTVRREQPPPSQDAWAIPGTRTAEETWDTDQTFLGDVQPSWDDNQETPF